MCIEPSTFLLLSVKANRNDTYLSLSRVRARTLRFLDAYFALLFMKSQRRANIEKRAQPVKSRVNKAREITKESLNIYTGSYSFFSSSSSSLLTIYGRSIIFHCYKFVYDDRLIFMSKRMYKQKKRNVIIKKRKLKHQ
jgi:hypothetical protein